MADTPAQAALREAFNSKLSVIPQTLSQEKQTQAQTNIGGPFLPLTGGTVSGTISATAFSGPLTGNATTASEWATARVITVSGDATGSVSVDGSENVTLNLTIASGSITNGMLAPGSVTFDKVDANDVATQDEAESGTVNTAFMTPLRVAQAVAAQIPPAVPTGMIAFFNLTEVPDGWLVCDGSAVSRTTYANLFAKIGTRHGSGDGSTTFILPDMNARFLEGTTDTGQVGTNVAPGLPNITGELPAGTFTTAGLPTGCFSRGSDGQHTWAGGSYAGISLVFNAAGSNQTYGSSSTVQPPALQGLFCIKT